MSALKYAVHAYAWTESWSNDTLWIVDHAKKLGFDLLEVPLMEIEKADPQSIRERAEAAGIDLCTSTACSEAADPTHEDAAVRAAAEDYLRRCVAATAEMGGTIFTGVTYAAIGRRINGFPDEAHYERAAKVLKAVARYANDLGVTLGIEPVNRYETFLVNTGDQALELIGRIGEPNVRVHLDAYHMNIEELEFFAPTLKAAPLLCHFHLSESHRGAPGTGTVDWESIYRALAQAKYSGVVGLESFESVSPAMAAATCIWRRMAESSDALLSEGLAYLKEVERKYYS